VLIDDYEHSVYPPLMRPRWQIVPEMISEDGLPCDPERIRKYAGLKEDVYVPDFRPDASILSHLGLTKNHLIVTVRPPATEAHYHNADGERLFFQVMEFMLANPAVRIVLLPRNDRQLHWLKNQKPRWFSDSRLIVPAAAVNGLNLVYHSDFVVSGGGTMNREAAALGVPAYSILRGPLGAVDHWLAQSGRLTLIWSPLDFETRLKLVPRARVPLSASADHRPPALRQIMSHLDEIIETELARASGGWFIQPSETSLAQPEAPPALCP
jgi:predicted glycosyltransferase